MAENASNSTREKSAMHPAVAISECVEFIKLIDGLGGKKVSYATILHALGISSPTTKSFINRVGASKQFNLIITGGSTAQLTDTAKKILYPTGNDSSMATLRTCFEKPPLYAKLVERFRDKALPSKMQLSNILLNEYRIIKNSKDNAAECFLNSAEHLGFIQNGILVLESEDDDVSEKPADIPVVQSGGSTDESLDTPLIATPSKTSAFNYEIPTLSGKSVRISIPQDVSTKDLDYIILYVQNMLPAFISNLKEELEKQ
jgi:hypothetical protein